jgi:hypothetical protein
VLWITAADSVVCQRELTAWGPDVDQSHECYSGDSSVRLSEV